MNTDHTDKTALRHIALVVPDLRAAEAYYQPLLGMRLIGREAQLDDGLWYSLPPDKGWVDAEAAGIKLGMLALRRGAFVLALMEGDVQPGQVYAIGLSMNPQEIAEVRARLPANAEVERNDPDSLVFRDPYGITWQIGTGGDFQTSGEFTGRWLKV